MDNKHSTIADNLLHEPGLGKRRFVILIVIVLGVSLFLVSVALNLYNSGGAAQLDLSRPGYKDVRQEAGKEEVAEAYPSSGTLDKEAMDKFRKMYGERTKRILSTKSFDPEAISDDSLQLFDKNDPAADNESSEATN